MNFRFFVLGLALLLVVVGCPSEPTHLVYIDLVTDVLPFVEFDGIRLDVGDYQREFLPDAETSYVEGVRLDTVALERGTTMLTLTLVRGREVVVSRRVVVETGDGSQVVTVLLSRDCRSITCSAQETCRGGQCVDPRCRPEALEYCTSECRTNDECNGEFAECAQPICRVGVCLGRDNMWCAPEEYCDPTNGCRVIPDAAHDAGSDAPSDAADAGASTCMENEHVDAHRCVPCSEGTTNEAGDEPSGADTVCEGDICMTTLGISCAVFAEADVQAGNNNLFGWAVALDGDTLAVGAHYDSSNATGIDGDSIDTSVPRAGAVYVFTRTGQEWLQQAYIKASNTDGGDEFGSALALDGNILVVGARGEDGEGFAEMIPVGGGPPGLGIDETDNSAANSGAAYVFVREGNSWSQEAFLKASNTDAGDSFGWSVAVSGTTLVIGAEAESSAAIGIGGDEMDNSAVRSGAVYVFTPTGASWAQQAYIKASNTERHDRFAWSVALDGDTLAVSSLDEGDGSGAVYVFTRSGNTWSEQAFLKASNANSDDWFGASLALDGDTLAIGSTSESSAATGIGGDELNNTSMQSGAVYVFVREALSWSQQAYIKASNTDAMDRFGVAVALHEDLLAVGASGEASAANGLGGDETLNTVPGSGAVYLFERIAGRWSQRMYLKPQTAEENGFFGQTLALDQNTLIIGGAQGETVVRVIAAF